ncbi:hypothetical protein PYCCODRAFT_1441057 [Trametes coccinea BRFM310]|uniref:DUF6533 domain-containing protein n=1 Tax=Trametes coccinea (strain BRFM310) TaxID=1353009 RepID=A0A1Y2I996_TRAC3|nr:hypothetical protein PYCCODRAFT_1441057 [Trametes coccinea BRFM310]
MSASPSDPHAAVVDFFASQFIGGCCATAILVLVLYEYVVTFADEIELFWKGKASSASVMFFLNRYLTLLGYLAAAPGTYHPITDIVNCRCRLTIVMFQGTDLLRYFPQAAFSSLRVYALSDRKKWPAGFVFLLFMGPVGANLSTLQWLHISNSPPPVGCVSSVMTIISRSCAIAADFLVVTVTWWKTRKSLKLYRQANLKTTYGSLILRDGMTVRCSCKVRSLLTLNVLHLALTLLAYTQEQEYISVSYMPIFTSPITSILVSRFLLNLRQVDRLSANPMGSEQPSFVNPHGREPLAEFASFVAPLHDDLQEDSSLQGNGIADQGSSTEAGSISEFRLVDSDGSHDEDEGTDPHQSHDVAEGDSVSPSSTSQQRRDTYDV